jgi:YVTN family beta-propeller protein
LKPEKTLQSAFLSLLFFLIVLLPILQSTVTSYQSAPTSSNISSGIRVVAKINMHVHSQPGLAYDSHNKLMYITSCAGTDYSCGRTTFKGNITLVSSSNQIMKAFTFGELTNYGLAYDPVHNYMFLADNGWLNNGYVYVLQGAREVAKLTAGKSPMGLAYDPDNKCMYLTDEQSAQVLVINGTTNRIITNITGFNGAGSVGYDPANKYLYIGSDDSNHVWVLNPKNDKIVADVNVPTPFDVIVYDPANQDMFVTSQTSDYVYVLSSF